MRTACEQCAGSGAGATPADEAARVARASADGASADGASADGATSTDFTPSGTASISLRVDQPARGSDSETRARRRAVP